MNYFAHGIRFLDRPDFVAGTAIPDWLSVVDRRVRMRSPKVRPFVDHVDRIWAELAAGVMQHLHDDRWFHGTAAFAETCTQMSKLFRGVLSDDGGHRTGFLGHITAELLIDRVLMETNPGLLDKYYNTLSDVDPQQVQSFVKAVAGKPADRLAELIAGFLRIRFLEDYIDPEKMLYRLNQVMGRVKLDPLPAPTVKVLEEGCDLVRLSIHKLLPSENFETGFLPTIE